MAFSLGGLVGAGTDCGCCTPEEALTCAPCNIPQRDLTVSYQSAGRICTSTRAMTYAAGPPVQWVWSGDICDSGSPFPMTFLLRCDEFGSVYLEVSGALGGCNTLDDPGNISISAYTCSPFHVAFGILTCASSYTFNYFYIDE